MVVKKSVFLMSVCAFGFAMASTAEAGKFNPDNLGPIDNLDIKKSTSKPQPNKPSKTMTAKRKNEETERMIKATQIKKQLDF